MSELITGQSVSAAQAAISGVNAAGKTLTATQSNEQLFSDALAASRVPTDTSAPPETLADNNQATEDRFLALLVAQMQNQDPMNPLENAEVTTQLAQINTVRGIEDLGQTVRQLLAQSSGNDPAASSNVLDRHVLVRGGEIQVAGDDASMTLGASVELPTNALTAQMVNSDGQSVRTILLGPQTPGITTFEWDGNDNNGDAVAPGTYELVVRAAGSDGAVGVQSLVAHQVTGVTRGQESIDYRIQGGANVPADDVLGIF